jgi:P4 family phage/plasmid primase-like protien
MAVKLFALRPDDLKPGKNRHVFTGIVAPTHQVLFTQAEKYIEKIPPAERWNVFYTTAHHGGQGKQRDGASFESQDILPFDIDGIDIALADSYIPIVANFLGLPDSQFTVVLSGNGLHFLVQLPKALELEEFNRLQAHYAECARKLQKLIEEAKLPVGKVDMIWDVARILRMPYTENRKPGKPVKRASVLQLDFTPHEINLKALSGLPDIPAGEALSEKTFTGSYAITDDEGVLNGCEFLKWTREKPLEVKEPQGYAALSILPRLQGGRPLAKEYLARWTNSRSLSSTDPDEKIDQAIAASPPRTCQSINLQWGECASCPYHGKVKSPISIQGPNFIRTEHTGFHDEVITTSGPRLIPNVHDLRKFFEKGSPYRVVNKKLIFSYTGRVYEKLGEMALPSFAETHFDPHVKTAVIEEFVNVVTRYNVVEADWFAQSTDGRVNFQNGTLVWETGELGSHSPALGFRYVLPFDYDPSARAPRWEQFLLEVFGGDQEQAQLAEEFVGYCLSGDRLWVQKALILLGEGENGKSTLIKVIQALAGEGNYSAVKVDRFNDPTFVQQLDGKLFNISGETPRRGFEETAGIKELIGGDVVTARELYGTPYTFQNRTKIVFSCNEIPRTLDNTHGFYRRFWILTFNQVFSKERGNADPHIDEKLALELPGIFNRVRQAYSDAKCRGKFTEPAASKQAIAELREEMDEAGTWIAGHLEETEGLDSWLTNREIWDAFRKYMEAEGMNREVQFWKSSKLARRVEKIFPRARKDRTKTDRGFRGLRLVNLNNPGHQSSF